MKTLPKSRNALLGLGCALFLASSGLAQTVSIESQLDVVIKLRIHRELQSTDETAAGVFVGKDRRNAYFITACHAVIHEEGAARSIRIRFHDSPQDIVATVFEFYDDKTLDLAVVSTAVTDLPPEVREIVRKDATLGIPVHIIGHPSAGDWSVASGTVQNLNASNGDIHHFTTSRDSSLAEGDSGGPVFDGSGDFLGMHTSSGPTYGVEAKSSEIMTQLAAWHVPTNNVTSVADDTATGTVTQSSERDLVNSAVEAYVTAYNNKDAPSLWKIWPDPPSQTRQAIESYFRNARSIAMHVTERKIRLNGAQATVTAQSYQDFLPKSGSVQKSPESPITFELEKHGAGWVITVVR